MTTDPSSDVERVARALCHELSALAGDEDAWRNYIDAARAAIAAMPTIERLSAELERLQAVEKAARKLPRRTPKAGASSTVHDFKIEACHVWANDEALTDLDEYRAALSNTAENG